MKVAQPIYNSQITVDKIDGFLIEHSKILWLLFLGGDL